MAFGARPSLMTSLSSLFPFHLLSLAVQKPQSGFVRHSKVFSMQFLQGFIFPHIPLLQQYGGNPF